MVSNSKDKAGLNVIKSLIQKNSLRKRAGNLTDTQRDIVPVVTCINSWNFCGSALDIVHGYHSKAVYCRF